MEPERVYCVMGVPGGWRVEGSRRYAVLREVKRQGMRVGKGYIVMVGEGFRR